MGERCPCLEAVVSSWIHVELGRNAGHHQSSRVLHALVEEEVQSTHLDEGRRKALEVSGAGRSGVYGNCFAPGRYVAEVRRPPEPVVFRAPSDVADPRILGWSDYCPVVEHGRGQRLEDDGRSTSVASEKRECGNQAGTSAFTADRNPMRIDFQFECIRVHPLENGVAVLYGAWVRRFRRTPVVDRQHEARQALGHPAGLEGHRRRGAHHVATSVDVEEGRCRAGQPGGAHGEYPNLHTLLQDMLGHYLPSSLVSLPQSAADLAIPASL